MSGEEKKLFDVPEALAYCEARFGRDFLYAVAHRGQVPVIWVGRRKLLFPRSSLDRLMQGELSGDPNGGSTR